jgi:hypothetical protein
MDDITYRGYWWLPETPETRIAGILSFSQENGAKLELIGVFNTMFENAPDDYSIILGLTTDGKPITLQGSFVTNRQFTTAMTETSDLLVRFIFVGIHVPDEESLQFNEIQASFTYLYDWAGVSGIERKQFKTGQKFRVSYSRPKDISVQIPDGKISLTFGAKGKTGYGTSNISENTSFYIKLKNSKTLFEILNEYLMPLQALVSLGTTRPSFVEELYFFLKGFPTDPITVYYSQKSYQPKKKENLIRPDMLFMLGDIYEDLETKINNWLTASKKIDSVLNLLRRVRISPELFLELKFLSLAQAIETYHRISRNNQVMPQEEHEARVTNILNGLSQIDADWLSKILAHTNEPRLAHRLNELLIENKLVINLLIDNPQDSNSRRGRFMSAITGSRNYYTHFDKAGEAGALQGGKLHYLTEKLSILLEACLLGELGIPPDQQPALFTQNDRYNRLTSK